MRCTYNSSKEVAGLSAAVVSADRSENEYREYRGFATYSPGVWRFSLDALTHRYKEGVSGPKDAYHVVGSAGGQGLPSLKHPGGSAPGGGRLPGVPRERFHRGAKAVRDLPAFPRVHPGAPDVRLAGAEPLPVVPWSVALPDVPRPERGTAAGHEA